MTAIEPKWLTEVAPTFFKVADSSRMSKRKKQEKIAPLFDRYAQNQDDCKFLMIFLVNVKPGTDRTINFREIVTPQKIDAHESNIWIRGGGFILCCISTGSNLVQAYTLRDSEPLWIQWQSL